MTSTSNPPDQERLDRLLSFLEQDPSNTSLLVDILLLATSGALQVTVLAQKLREHVTAHEINDPIVHAHLSHLQLLAHDYAAAAEHGDRAIDGGIDHPAVLFNTAFGHFYSADYASSAKALQPVTSQPNPPVSALILHARALHHLESDDAETLVKQALEVEPDNTEALGLLALLLNERDAYDESLQLAHEVLSREPNQLDALLACASTHTEQGRIEAARSTWQHTVKAHPDCGRAWSGLAQVEFHELEFDQAEEHLKTAVTLMPDHIGTWHLLAWIYIMRGDSAQAREALDKSYALDRNFGETHGGLAVVDALDGKHDNARLGIRRALKLNPHSMSARYAEIVLLQQAGKHDEANAVVQQTLDKPVANENTTGRMLVEHWLAQHQGRSTQKPPSHQH